MKNIMRLLFGLTCSVVLVMAGCGGGSSSNTGVADYNKLLNGSFQVHQAGDNTAAGAIVVERVDITADGAGTVTSPGGTVTYTVAIDRTVTVDTGASTVAGILSADSSLMVLSDTDRTVSAVAPLSDERIVLAAGMKKTAGLDVAKLSGDYQIHQFGTGGTGGYTAKVASVNITADGAGAGTWAILNDSEGSTGNGAFTYTVSATDGTFSVTTSVPGPTVIGTDYGILSADGSLFVLTDIDPVAVVGVEDAEIVLAVGVKKSTTLTNATFNGNYQLNQIGDAGTGRSTARVNLTADGNGGGTYAVVASSAGGAGGSGNFTYTVSADGTFTVDLGAGVAKQGILSADGSMFVLSDTEKALDLEIVLAVGIKK